jgi:outer membrane lipoprotein-sorting protein
MEIIINIKIIRSSVYPLIRSSAYLFLCLSVFFSSCSASRKAIKAPIKEEGAEYLFSKLKEKELRFDWFSAKFSAEYENKGKSNSFSGQIRIRKDSLIWISLTPMLGIEAIRLMISQDSVKMINRLNDTYFIGDYEYVNQFLNTNIDYDLLQAFLLGNDLQFYESGEFRAGIDNGEYKLSTAGRQKLKKFVRSSQEKLKIFIQQIWLDAQTFKITHAEVKEARRENIKLESNYGQFEDVGGQLFPTDMRYTIWAENTIRVTAGFSRMQINNPQQFPFKIPASFSKAK